MITFFNKQLVYSTSDIRRQGTIQNLMRDNGIEYDFRVLDKFQLLPYWECRKAKKANGGEWSLDLVYTISVHKNDFERADRIIKDFERSENASDKP